MNKNDRMSELYTAEQVRRIDRYAIACLGVTAGELMQRAADAAFAVLRRRWPTARRIVLLAGIGNNGGDAFLLGRRALQHGYSVDAIALGERSTGDAATARALFTADGGAIRIAEADMPMPDADICVDGLFGTGLSRAVDGTAATLIRTLTASSLPVLSLDLPSGLDADSGVPLGPTVMATATVCFVAWKRGLFTADASDYCGERELAALDLDDQAYDGIDADAELIGPALAKPFPARRFNVNKGSFGHVLAIGSDHGMGGAIRLTGMAALRCGAGLVSVATRPEHVPAINGACPELLACGIGSASDLLPLLARATVVAVGPGLGQQAWGRELFAAALDCGRPLVIDADGLNLLATSPNRAVPADVVLTPHPGEAARLLDVDTVAIQRDRFAAARELARRYAAIVVLKGAGSLIASPAGRVAVCPWGNPGMASAGMGDVLTGVIAALIAQGESTWDAASLGVALHARAGDLAAADAPRGLLASDLFVPLRRFVNGPLE